MNDICSYSRSQDSIPVSFISVIYLVDLWSEYAILAERKG